MAAGRKSALRTYCGVVASSPRTENGMAMVDERLLKGLLEALIITSSGSGDNTSGGTTTAGAGMDEQMLHLLDGEFLRPHPDARYFALLALRQIAGEIYEKYNKGGADSNTHTKGADDDDAGVRAENLLRILSFGSTLPVPPTGRWRTGRRSWSLLLLPE